MSRASWFFGVWPGAIIFGLLAAGAVCAAEAAKAKQPVQDSTNCSACHDQGAKLAKSAHAGLTCDTCHESHDKYPHPAVAKPQCTTCHQDQAGEYALGVHGQARQKGDESAPDCATCHGGAHELLSPESEAFRKSVPDTCGMCHSDVAAQYNASVHGQAVAHGVVAAPVCSDCHGEHKIIKPSDAASPVNPRHIRDTCGGCHGNVTLTRRFGMPADRLVSFDASYHGLAAKAGSETVANCASCHGVHNILSSSDPKSTTNPRNLPQTCGKCHPGAGTRFAISQVHIVEGRDGPPALNWIRLFYLFLIPATIGLMLLHNGGDWIRKLLKLRFKRTPSPDPWPPTSGPSGPGPLRMLPFERLQHALLAISFLTLVYTGFALRYPHDVWAQPLILLEHGHPLRGLIHRIAAVIFMGVATTHAVSLMASRRLRNHWKEMLPNRTDATEAAANLAYNIGLISTDPGRSAHSYIEKAEYWAVVWGAVVMIATGVLLWANNLVLRFLPKSWLDVATSIHFYEAVLATLAIVVWHFYSVILDPDVYPLNTAFLTGFSVKREEYSELSKAPGSHGAHAAGDFANWK